MGITIAATPRKATCNSAASVTAGSQYFASVIAVVNKGRILFIIDFFVILILVPDYFAVFGVSTTYNSANIGSSGYCASVNTFSDGCSPLMSANTTCLASENARCIQASSNRGSIIYIFKTVV